jgi:hypothetical protein
VKKQNDCSPLGGIEPQTNLTFIPHQIEGDYGVGIPAELAKNIETDEVQNGELVTSIGLFTQTLDAFTVLLGLNNPRINSRKAQKLALFRSWDAPVEASPNA